MGMSEFYGSTNDAESIRAIHHAIDCGIDFFDTADMYGQGHNEALLGRALAGRGDAIVATKFGLLRDDRGRFIGMCGRPDYVRASCDASLRRLGTDRVDLYYCHRVDPDVPIEETVGAMAELVREGKVGALGLSEVSANLLKRAHAVHPIAAVQSEYSLWDRGPEQTLFPTLEALNVGFVAYGALGRGYLTGAIRSIDDLEANDTRRKTPRFQGDALQANLKLLQPLHDLAEEKRVTPAQLALAWTMGRRDFIVPIAGSKRAERVEENAVAASITLTANEIDELAALFCAGAVVGDRYAQKTPPRTPAN